MKNLLINYFLRLGENARRERMALVKKWLKELEGSRSILDCGCDDGNLTVELAKAAKVEKVYGIEVIPERCDLARKRGIEVFESDLNRPFPCEDSFIDIITCLQTIEHLVNLDNFLSEVKRVLKPYGHFIISTENLASWHNIFALLVGNQPYTGPYLSKKPVAHHPLRSVLKEKKPEISKMPLHLNVMTAKALCQLLKQSGFTIEKAKGIGFYPFPGETAAFLAVIDRNHSTFCVVQAVNSE